MSQTTVSKKGLTTIPRVVMEQLSLDEGDRIVWQVTLEGGEKVARVKPLPNPYKKLKGRRKNLELTYEKVEGLADSLIKEEAGR